MIHLGEGLELRETFLWGKDKIKPIIQCLQILLTSAPIGEI